MRQTVIGVFAQTDAAQAAMNTLADALFDPNRVHALRTAEIPTLTDVAVDPGPRLGVLGQLRQFLSDGPGQAALLYDGIARRGSAVVSVEVDDQPQAVRAELALVKAGAIDITRHTDG